MLLSPAEEGSGLVAPKHGAEIVQAAAVFVFFRRKYIRNIAAITTLLKIPFSVLPREASELLPNPTQFDLLVSRFGRCAKVPLRLKRDIGGCEVMRMRECDAAFPPIDHHGATDS